MTRVKSIGCAFAILLMTGCGGSMKTVSPDAVAAQQQNLEYVIGAGDGIEVFVWGHDDLSAKVQVRPDGLISTPLVEDLQASGKTPTQLARLVEERLSEYVRSPTVTVIVQQFVGEYDRQVRVVGQAAEPQALNYRDGMTLLDVMIQVGGLSEFASGNRAKVVRRRNGEQVAIEVHIHDLLNEGDMTQNIEMLPGDVVIIPESIF